VNADLRLLSAVKRPSEARVGEGGAAKKRCIIQANFHLEERRRRRRRSTASCVVSLLSRCRFNDGLLPLPSFLITRSFELAVVTRQSYHSRVTKSRSFWRIRAAHRGAAEGFVPADWIFKLRLIVPSARFI